MLLLAILIAAAACITIVLALVGLVIGPYVVAYFVGSKVRNAAAQKDSEGRSVAMTPMARVGMGNLPISLGFVAGLGNEATPELAAGTLVLRPTWGVRMISIVFSALIVFFVYVGRGTMVPDAAYTWPLTILVIGYGVLSTNIYELRYDSDGFVTTGFARTRKEVQWRDLSRITDNGHYLYNFKLFSGRSVEVQKYLVGIREFLSYAHAQMEYHDRH